MQPQGAFWLGWGFVFILRGLGTPEDFGMEALCCGEKGQV